MQFLDTVKKSHQTDMRLMKTHHNKIQLHLHNVNFLFIYYYYYYYFFFAVKILQEKTNT